MLVYLIDRSSTQAKIMCQIMSNHIHITDGHSLYLSIVLIFRNVCDGGMPGGAKPSTTMLRKH